MGVQNITASWDEWEIKQKVYDRLQSKGLPESYSYWGNILSKSFSKFCVVEGNILDIGCGNPDHSIKYFGGKNFYYIGLDPLAPKITSVIPVVKGLGEDLPFGDSSFDNVAIMSILDHVVDPNIVIFEASRVLKVGGFLYILILVWTDNFSVENDEYHFRHFSEQEIYDLIPKNFRIEETQFIPYKEKYRRVMYLKAKKKEISV